MALTAIDPTVLNGLFALAGAIVGGALTGLFTLWVERLRDRREDLREKVDRVAQIRQAARVIDAELEQAERSARIAVERRQWWAKEIGPLEVGSWNQYRAVLASEMSLDDWRLIANAFGFIHGINSAWAMSFRESPFRDATIQFHPPPGPPMTEDDQNRLPFGIGWITQARECLQKLLIDASERPILART